MRRFEARVGPDCVVWLSGDLDASWAVEFASTATSTVSASSSSDMTELAFIDSSGVQALLEVAMRTYRGLALRGPQPIVRKVLDITASSDATRSA